MLPMMRSSRKSKVSASAPKPAAAIVEAPKSIATQPVAKPAVTAKPQATVKPEASKLGAVSFQLVKPGAKSVYVAGSFNEWQPERAPLVQVDGGRWAAQLPLKPGRHEYLFVVDGQWLPDPNAREAVQNPFGGQNSVVVVE